MTYPYTFKINGTDFATKVQRYSYSTSYTPVYTDNITTMDGVDHAVIKRWRHGLSVVLNPMSETDLATLQTALQNSTIASVQFSSLQLGVDVTCNMILNTEASTLVLKNASRRVLSELPLTFTEM